MKWVARLGPASAIMPAIMLGGCLGGLMGGGKPDRLYRFGDPAATSAAPLAVPRRVLGMLPVRMPAASAGDRILTVDGAASAYVKDVRWISPASLLFADAVRGALNTRIPDTALTDRVTAGQVDSYLTVRIDRFEARYDSADGAPVVLVEGQAILSDPATRAIVARLSIAERERAGGAGAAMLAAAFDVAVRRAGVGIADWVNDRLPVRTRAPVADPARSSAVRSGS